MDDLGCLLLLVAFTIWNRNEPIPLSSWPTLSLTPLSLPTQLTRITLRRDRRGTLRSLQQRLAIEFADLGVHRVGVCFVDVFFAHAARPQSVQHAVVGVSVHCLLGCCGACRWCYRCR